MRARLLVFVVVAALALLGTAGAKAQDATPAAAGLFAGLGLPELSVTATNDGFTLSQSEVPAGRYLVTLNNESDNPEVAAGFVRLSEGKTLEDLSGADEMAAGTPFPEEGPPPETFAWLFDTYVAGGVSAVSPQAVVDLRGGNYGVWADDPTSSIPAAPLTVTGDPDAKIEGPEPESSVTIVEEGAGGQGFKFTVSGELKSGPQIVQILNATDQPHFVYAWQYPEEITTDQLDALFAFDPMSGATPPPGMIDESRLELAAYAPVQSLGTKQWVQMDFAPGQAILVCFVPDPVTGGTPHAFEGMRALVPVT
jgi:hypothetical protein